MKAKDLIQERDQLSITISKYWNIMNIENVVHRNYKRNYDLKQLFIEIKSLGNARAMVKLKLLAINMGITKFGDIPPTCNQYNVFLLSELQEQKVRLNRIKTINPVLKAKKGKKNLNKTEVLTSNWIKARTEELDREILKLKDQLSAFNESAELDESNAPLQMVA